MGIGHTRWATHGEANDRNAHPHLCGNRQFAIVHNGIIENYQDLKDRLKGLGYIFRSETDSEVIVHLIEHYFKGNLEDAVQEACKDLDGSFAICAISEQDDQKIVAVRNGSPLIIGIGEDETHVASDINAIIPHTKQVAFLEDKQIAVIQQNDIQIKDLKTIPLNLKHSKSPGQLKIQKKADLSHLWKKKSKNNRLSFEKF